MALKVTNTSQFDRSGVQLRMRYPVGLEPLQQAAISDGGSCNGIFGSGLNCDPREIVVWDLGTVPAGTAVNVELNPVIAATTAEGELVAFHAVVEDTSDRSRSSKIVRVGEDDVKLVAAILPASRSVQVGNTATVFATIINSGNSDGISCGIAPVTTLSASFSYQTTDP